MNVRGLGAGMYAGDDYIDPNALPTWHNVSYVTAMLKGQYCEFSLRGGDATRGNLTTLYDGVRPQHNDYSPMKLQGNIILGTGGDNSEGAAGACAARCPTPQPVQCGSSDTAHCGVGTFFEGAMTRGWASAEAEDAVFANIVAAGFGR